MVTASAAELRDPSRKGLNTFIRSRFEQNWDSVPLDVDQLRGDLGAAGGGAIDVTVLSPELWYLSGGGLQSVRLQVEEVVDALR